MLRIGAAGCVAITAVVLPLLAATTLLTGPVPSATAATDIPPAYLSTYRDAVTQRCPTLAWTVLAAVGKVESDHGRAGGASLRADGRVLPAIIGIPLDGSAGTQAIADTDAGLFDGDPVHDRAVGPMQFIPSTWASVGVDASGDGLADPHSMVDAVHTAARYLCDAGAGDPARLRDAIWSYNHSAAYVEEVLQWAARYSAAATAHPADPVLVAAVLGSSRLDIDPDGRADIAAGRIDNRVLTVLLLATEHWAVSVSSLQTGHSKCVGGGSYDGCNISNHWYGRAFDVHRVNGRPVTPTNSDALDLARWLAVLSADLRADGVGTPWAGLGHLDGYFHDAGHLDHIHVGYDR